MPKGPGRTGNPIRGAFSRARPCGTNCMTAGLETPTPTRDAEGLDLRDDTLSLEGRGWSPEPSACEPKIAALASLFNLAPPDPVARVSYASRGNLLVILGDDAARGRAVAESLGARLNVAVLSCTPHAAT